jgi:hypothetical protein
MIDGMPAAASGPGLGLLVASTATSLSDAPKRPRERTLTLEGVGGGGPSSTPATFGSARATCGPSCAQPARVRQSGNTQAPRQRLEFPNVHSAGRLPSIEGYSWHVVCRRRSSASAGPNKSPRRTCVSTAFGSACANGLLLELRNPAVHLSFPLRASIRHHRSIEHAIGRIGRSNRSAPPERPSPAAAPAR